MNIQIKTYPVEFNFKIDGEKPFMINQFVQGKFKDGVFFYSTYVEAKYSQYWTIFTPYSKENVKKEIHTNDLVMWHLNHYLVLTNAAKKICIGTKVLARINRGNTAIQVNENFRERTREEAIISNVRINGIFLNVEYTFSDGYKYELMSSAETTDGIIKEIEED